MNHYHFNFELENFNDGKGRRKVSLQTAINNLSYDGLIYATTEYPISSGRIAICLVKVDSIEISGKTIEEIKDLLNKLVNKKRFPPNRKLEKLFPLERIES